MNDRLAPVVSLLMKHIRKYASEQTGQSLDGDA
jgi:hypothetical protein